MTTLACPVLRVADAAASVEWYRQIGFEQVFEHRHAPDLPAYVGIQRDEAVIHLSEHAGDAPGRGLVYIWIDEIDPIAEQFGIVPDEMPWARDIELADPDGNRIRLGQARTDD